jgi:predicted nucleic acid-binding protein
MDDVTFIDANVLVYHLGQPEHQFAPPSSALFTRLRAGSEIAFLSSTVVLETIHVFRTRFNIPNDVLAHALIEILSFRGIRTDHPDALVDALTFWSTQGPLSFADCFHLALTKQLGLAGIYSFDRKVNRYPGVERVEPT